MATRKNREMNENLNIRQMQLFSAICLARFCSSIGLVNSSIFRLISHLVEMSIAPDLMAWDRRGTTLEVTGRGDPLPFDITICVDIKDLVVLREIIDSSVEVGICDLYGNPTNQPFFFMNKCADILRNRKIELPSLEIIGSYRSGGGAFGDPIHNEDLSKILELHGMSLNLGL